MCPNDPIVTSSPHSKSRRPLSRSPSPSSCWAVSPPQVASRCARYSTTSNRLFTSRRRTTPHSPPRCMRCACRVTRSGPARACTTHRFSYLLSKHSRHHRPSRPCVCCGLRRYRRCRRSVAPCFPSCSRRCASRRVSSTRTRCCRCCRRGGVTLPTPFTTSG